MTGGELLGILRQFRQRGADPVRAGYPSLLFVGQGLEGGKFGPESLDLLVDAGGHLIGALLHQGRCAWSGRRWRSRGGINGSLAWSHVLDLDDRAVRIARHLHIGTKLRQ